MPQLSSAYIRHGAHEISREIDQELHIGLMIYSSDKLYCVSEDINQELNRGLLLIVLLETYKMSEEMNQELHRDQELHRCLLLIFLSKMC